MKNSISLKLRFRCRRSAAIFGLIAIALGAGWLTADELADEPAATFFEPYRVPLVSVEVVATDKDGVPIRGLTRDDFQVFEDNVEVEISHFFVSDPELAQNDPVAYQEDLPENFRQNLYLALYFDDTNIDPRRRTSALQHLRDFLEQPLPENVKAMLVRFDGSLHVEVSFSDQTDDLVDAVERIMAEPALTMPMGGAGVVRRMQSVAANQRITRSSTDLGGPSVPGVAQAFDLDGYVEPRQIEESAFLLEIRAYAETQYVRNRASLEALEGFIGRMQAIRGRKVVLWVGDLEMRAGENVFRTWQELFPDQARRQTINPMMETMQYDLSRDLRELVDRANSNRISFYTLSSLAASAPSTAEMNQRILETSGRPGQQGQRDIRSQNDALMVMSDLSGGRMLSDNAKLGEQLTRVAEELETFYSMAYTPPSPGDGKQHSIKVVVDRENVRLRHRLSYKDSEVADGTADRTLVAGMLGVAENPLAISVECQKQELRDDGTFLVPVLISIPIGELVLLPEEGRHQAQISVYSVVFDEAGRSSDVHERAYPIEIENDHLLSAVEQDAKFVIGMVLRDGPHRIAVSIRDDRSSSESTAIVDVLVGNDTGDTIE
jgi:VWFA-related protein